jgi:hypothetical protein
MLSRVVRLALRPLELIVQGGERLMSNVERKLGGVPEDRLLPPPPTIAAPAALHYALLGEGAEVAELREMFENLLIASMDRNTVASAHPAFVSMISQLTCDEAWLLKSVEQPEYPLIWVHTYEPNTKISHGIRSLLGVDLSIAPPLFQQYISNLERLGILRIVSRAMLVIEQYNQLEEMIKVEFGWNKAELDRASLQAGTIEVTPFGRQFLDICVRHRAR